LIIILPNLYLGFTVYLILFSMHLSLRHQFVVGKLQRSWWCCRSFRAQCQAPRCACCLLHSYSRDNFDCRSIRAIFIVSEKAGLVFCSTPLAKSRVNYTLFRGDGQTVKIGYATQDRTRANPCSFPSTGFLRYMGEISGLASPRLIWSDLGRFHTPRHRRAVTQTLCFCDGI